jgi:hypothetical protein
VAKKSTLTPALSPQGRGRKEHEKKRRHGKVYELPEAVRHEVNALIVQPEITYEDISAFLKTRGYDISTSAIGRYCQWFFNEVRETEMLRDQAKLLTSDPDKVLLLEKLTSSMIVKRLAIALQEEEFDVMKNAKLIAAYASLQKANLDREKWGAEIQKTIKGVAEDVSKIVKKNGLSEAAASQIRNKILGIKT